MLQKPWPVRENHPDYLAHARKLYSQIQQQIQGLRWEDGGPIIGIQIENEYAEPAEHLLRLKEIAVEVGLEVPFYTRTGWPALTSPMPYGELLPLFGVYAEGFWDRELHSMPGTYREGFRFSSRRTEAAIGTDQLGSREASDEADAHRYPYCTYEIGGGMMNSYHRRILIDSIDVGSTALVKIGSGGNLPGYYMYCGGINPEGSETSLQESLETSYPNELPVKSYDFQAPIGAAGQLLPHYFGLRRMHLFFQDCGERIAQMQPVFDLERANGSASEFPQLALRTDGDAGLLFVNHYERGRKLGTGQLHPLDLCIGDQSITFPGGKLEIPEACSCFWPLRWPLGHGIRIQWITAQPICFIEEGNQLIWYFAETPGVPVELALVGDDEQAVVKTLAVGRDTAWETMAEDGVRIQIVVLSDGDSRKLSKETTGGHSRVEFSEKTDSPQQFDIDMECLREAGEATQVTFKGEGAAAVPAAPPETSFSQAARWKLNLEAALRAGTDGLLHIRYRGDILRVYLDGRFIYDDFYNGSAIELNPAYWDDWTADSQVELEILPLRSDSPIFLADGLKPNSGQVCELVSVQWIL